MPPAKRAHNPAGRRRRGTHMLCAPIDVSVDDAAVGVVIDGDTVATMVGVWGAPYVPTLLHPHRADTSNTLPVSVVAAQMQQYGLPVDVDIICEGRRTVRDNYAEHYQTLLAGRPAAGQRTTTVLVRLDSRARDTVGGLSWRRDNVSATIAATQRIVHALNQNGCRAHILTAAQIREAMTASLGGREGLTGTYRDEWSRLSTGKGYLTSYFFSSDDVAAATLADVWSYPCDHAALVVGLRRRAGEIRASAMVRLHTSQPYASPPALMLNKFTGRHWDAVVGTLPGRARLRLPSTPLDGEALDKAIVVGSSGVLLGKFGDAMLLMPLSDPAAPTRIAVRVDDDMAVRRLIRRAAAVGEHVAVYDTAQRWGMSAGSARIWSSTDVSAQPPRPPTLVVHNGRSNPYPGARTAVAVGAPDSSAADIVIEQAGNRITLRTNRFATTLDAVSFRNEEAYLR